MATFPRREASHLLCGVCEEQPSARPRVWRALAAFGAPPALRHSSSRTRSTTSGRSSRPQSGRRLTPTRRLFTVGSDVLSCCNVNSYVTCIVQRLPYDLRI